MTDKTTNGVDEATDKAHASKTRLSTPARISLIYESRDKRLCLFEDAQGHLTAVRASRLA